MLGIATKIAVRLSPNPPAVLRDLVARAPRTFVAEVGVGVVHLPEPAPVPPVDPAVAELHLRLKASFDPTGRLNPGLSPLPI